MLIPAIMWDRSCPAPVEAALSIAAVTRRRFESVLGRFELERAYYYCEQCQSGFCPRDRALGLGMLSDGMAHSGMNLRNRVRIPVNVIH
jgi:hypothetical protein